MPILKLLESSTTLDAATRTVQVICSTESPDRIGDVVVQSGIDVTSYRSNPVVLWGHDSDMPVARGVAIGVIDGVLRSTVQFPPPGEDEDADWVYGKIKNGLVNAVSIGFVPKSYEPVDPKNPWDGYRFTESELVEFSFVSVPMNAEALIVGRSLLAPVGREQTPPSRLAALTVLETAEAEAAARAAATAAAEAADAARAAGLDPEAKELEAALAVINKAGRVLSAANEECLRGAHAAIGGVLDQIQTGQQTEALDPEPTNFRQRQAVVEGRSDATRFPRRTAREVEILKLRAS